MKNTYNLKDKCKRSIEHWSLKFNLKINRMTFTKRTKIYCHSIVNKKTCFERSEYFLLTVPIYNVASSFNDSANGKVMKIISAYETQLHHLKARLCVKSSLND